MEYFTLLTQIGAQKIAAATAANTTVALAEIALGDGNGTVPMPDASKTALVNEVYRAPLNDLRVDENNANWLVAEGYIPSDEGNFWVREVGIFDSDGDLIIIGNYSETFKPVTADGVAKDLYMKVITEVSSADAVNLLVDPSVVMASKEFVNNEIAKKAEKNHNHDTVYAAINGDASKNFSVKAGTSAKHAVNKEQMETALNNISLDVLQSKTISLGDVTAGRNVNTLIGTVTLSKARTSGTKLLCFVGAVGNNSSAGSVMAHGLHILAPYGGTGGKLIWQVTGNNQSESYWQFPVSGHKEIDDESTIEVPLYVHGYNTSGAGMIFMDLVFTVMEIKK